MTKTRILITAGGTGGHLYPAQALAHQLQKQAQDVLFVAGGLAANRYFDRERFVYQEISCSPLLSRHPLKCLKGLLHLYRGVRQSIAILKHYQPAAVVGFGSYYTVSTLLAAKWLKIPIVLHEANSVPGKANRWLASMATCVGLHFPATAAYFKGKTVVVGLPLREGYCKTAVTKEEAAAYYGLSTDKRTLLICGGSQGARAINLMIKECLSVFKQLALQVVHLTGDAEMAEQLKELYAAHQIPACVKAFENQMDKAWRMADAFLGRSGASTVAEALAFEVPGILIPYPYATDQHQEKNADFFVSTVGAGTKLLEPGLTPPVLKRALEQLFQSENYDSLQQALHRYQQREDQITLSQLILNLTTRN